MGRDPESYVQTHGAARWAGMRAIGAKRAPASTRVTAHERGGYFSSMRSCYIPNLGLKLFRKPVHPSGPLRSIRISGGRDHLSSDLVT